MESVRLGGSDVQISPLGFGTWAWGETSVWDYGKMYGDHDLKQAYDASLGSGMGIIDTAEGYAEGESERILGRIIRESGTRKQVVIATKFSPHRWRFLRRHLLGALRRSLKRLSLEYVDLYQIHWPSRCVSIETWIHALADAFEAGLTRAVGVSNYGVDELKRAHATLASRGIPLASNQIQYNLLDRKSEKDGMIRLCRDLGVTVIAYSPLSQGILTGKYTPEHLPPGQRGNQYNREFLSRVQPLLGLMREIGEAHGGKSQAEVALNWTMCKGSVPIPGAKNLKQARENLGSLGWRLSDGDVRELDKTSETLQPLGT